MRESGNGQRTVFPWSDAQAPYVVGDTVYSGASRGTVVSVDATEVTMGIIWTDSYNDELNEITYPLDATYVRKAFPWE